MTDGHRIAVVGAGPAGIYFADALSRLNASVGIDVIERLPFPYGLIRYGVAADHQGTKAVTQILARAMKRPGVSYFGGVEVGRHIRLDELHDGYDAVVLATGGGGGRRLPFRGSEEAPNVTAFDFSRWLNSHPDCKKLLSRPVRSVSVIGNGNVALDMVRLLAKPIADLEKLDLSNEGIEWLRSNKIEEINVIGRSNAGATKFSPAELEELERLACFELNVSLTEVTGSEDTKNAPALEILRRFAEAPTRGYRRINFRFGREVTEFRNDRLKMSTLAGDDEVAADLIIHGIGQEISAIAGHASRADSRFSVGWATGTGRGTIQETRTNAQDVARRVAAWLRDRHPRTPGRPLADILRERSVNLVSWEIWQQIDHSEVARGKLLGKIRHKYCSLHEYETFGVVSPGMLREIAS